MNRRDELKAAYKEIKTEAGVFRIVNTANNKMLVESTRNLKTIEGKRFQLGMGGHMNKALQADWNAFGEETFTFEILEVLKKKEHGYFDEKEELKKLEKKWLDELQPYGDKGYNR